jgi:hypothetical protein
MVSDSKVILKKSDLALRLLTLLRTLEVTPVAETANRDRYLEVFQILVTMPDCQAKVSDKPRRLQQPNNQGAFRSRGRLYHQPGIILKMKVSILPCFYNIIVSFKIIRNN